MTRDKKRSLFFSTIPARLALKPMILLFAALAAAGAAFYLMPEFSSLRSPQISYLSAVTSEKKTAADFWFREHISELELLAKQPLIKLNAAYIGKDTPQDRKTKSRKTTLTRSAKQQAVSAVSALLKDRAVSEYRSISLIHTDGTITASSDPSAAGSIWSSLEYIGQDMDSIKAPLVRLVGTSLEKDLEIFVPVTDDEGAVVSALLSRVSTSRLLSLMKIEKPLYTSLAIEIADQSGRIVFGQPLFNKASTPNLLPESGLYVSTKKLQYAPLSLVGKVNRSETASGLRLLAGIYFGLMAFIVLLMLYVYLRGRRLVTKPVNQLADAADAYSRGEAFITDGTLFRGELAELKQSFDNLLSGIADRESKRTLSLIEQEMSRARAMLMDSLSSALHRASVPLIDGSSAIRLKSAGLSAALKTELVRISDISSRIGVLAAALRDMAELEKGAQLFSPSELNLKVFYDDIVKEADAIADAGHLTLVSDLEDVDDSHAAYADAYWLRKLVLAAVGNAAANTDSGTITLVVSRVADEGISILRMNVADTGSGMDDESLKMLDAGTLFDSRHIQLALARKIALLMQGSMSVESVEGKGLAVMISVPLETS